MLVKEARYWWEATERLLTTSSVRMTPKAIMWKQFVEAFNKKYFPLVYRYEKKNEFIYLTQANMSVTNYEHKFTAQALFVPSIMGNEEEKCKRFQMG